MVCHLEISKVDYYIDPDEFCKFFEKEFKVHVLSDGRGIRNRASILTLSKVISIAAYYHQSKYKTFLNF